MSDATAESPAPLVVVDRAESLDDAAARLEAAGWRLRDGFGLPERTWDLRGLHLVCVGEVRSAADAAAAVLAASRGAGLVAKVQLEHGARGRFLEDLRHIGPVEQSPAASAALDGDQRRALEILAAGGSLEDVARELSYSRRTVSRKLAGARRALGVQSNAEAVRLTATRRP